MAKPYKEGKHWSVRVRARGQDIYLTGFTSESAAQAAADKEKVTLLSNNRPAGYGPRKTNVAQAFQQYALERLPSMKGASRDAGRINKYLRLANLMTIKLEPTDRRQNVVPGTYYKVSLFDENNERNIPGSLKPHRNKLLEKSSKSDMHRKRLATTPVAEVTPYLVQQVLDAMLQEGYEPATIAHERSEIRRLFNHAKKCWLWPQPSINPASHVKVPPIRNERDRIITNAEWQRIVNALQSYDNDYALPALELLLDTTMRSSEPLLHATWSDVDWHRCLIHLKDAKAGPRSVPLSPNALSVLTYLKIRAGDPTPDKPILPTTYEALKKAWKIACQKAGIENARLHDLRHTGTTRYAIKFNGNMPVLKLITGHKTYSQLMRYINLKADDVVSMMHNKPIDHDHAPAGLSENVVDEIVSPTLRTHRQDTSNLPINIISFPSGRRAA